MKKILFIATGGTIASAKTEEGLTPAMTSEELLDAVPAIRTMCHVDTVQPYSLDSTNMCWKQWTHLAEIIRDGYEKYDGFVITHGTDTMSYAAATLSYLVQNNLKPIVFTGAQKSIAEVDGDARRNLYEAFTYATDPRACGTHVVFNGHVIAGTRARKTHSKSFDAFSSIDYPDVGVFFDRKLLCYIDERNEIRGNVQFYDRMDPSIISIRVIPGMDPSIFDYIVHNCHGVVIESFGVGGIPYYGDNAFEEKIAALMENGVRVVITTQVPHEGSNLSVYRVGHMIKKKYRVLEANSMTTEAVIAKMMWALAYSDTREDFETLFRTPVGKDML
ncbi:MAG: asparaginase [Clostridia bacterium]|nr:asparaginase [Clostridia bacterium]